MADEKKNTGPEVEPIVTEAPPRRKIPAGRPRPLRRSRRPKRTPSPVWRKSPIPLKR